MTHVCVSWWGATVAALRGRRCCGAHLNNGRCQAGKWSWCRSLRIQWSLCRCPAAAVLTRDLVAFTCPFLPLSRHARLAGATAMGQPGHRLPAIRPCHRQLCADRAPGMLLPGVPHAPERSSLGGPLPGRAEWVVVGDARAPRDCFKSSPPPHASRDGCFPLSLRCAMHSCVGLGGLCALCGSSASVGFHRFLKSPFFLFKPGQSPWNPFAPRCCQCRVMMPWLGSTRAGLGEGPPWHGEPAGCLST